MQDWPRDLIQTHVAPLLSAIRARVLGWGYTRLHVHAHLIAREILASATVAALKRIRFPGALALGSISLTVEFARLLPAEIEREFARIQAHPEDWIRPGNPIAFIGHQDLANDYNALTGILDFVKPLLDPDTLADEDSQYIAQCVLDDGVLSVPGDDLPGVYGAYYGAYLDEDDDTVIPTVTMEPLVPGGPSEEVPVYYLPDEGNGEIEVSAEAELDAAGFDLLVDLLSPVCLPTNVRGSFARLEDIEWLGTALPKLPWRERKLILRVYIDGMGFDFHTPDDVSLDLFVALTHLLELWNKDHPWT